MFGQGATISKLIGGIRPTLHARVTDKTGLTGKYDFTLAFPADSGNVPGGFPAESALIDAVRERLGLDLEPAKVSLPVIVVDSIDRVPADN